MELIVVVTDVDDPAVRPQFTVVFAQSVSSVSDLPDSALPFESLTVMERRPLFPRAMFGPLLTTTLMTTPASVHVVDPSAPPVTALRTALSPVLEVVERTVVTYCPEPLVVPVGAAKDTPAVPVDQDTVRPGAAAPDESATAATTVALSP
ncbi:hypothetical protein HR12_11105 [Microbacterium sp. SUBG005]|nr:hypothetical protein HR12_11105 [Microbacterium sp. SUBG005]